MMDAMLAALSWMDPPMRTSLLMLPLFSGLLAACAATPTPEPAPPVSCNIAPANAYVGKRADHGVTEAARKATGANSVRVLGPGDVATMDYRGDRLNIMVDGQRVITRLTCG